MNPQNPRLIALDLDGTLLNSEGRVSARNLAALGLAESCGVETVLATGRRHAFAMGVLHGLNLRPSNALVSSNGTVIRTLGAELLHRSHMPLATARWLCAYAAEFRSTLVLTFDTVGPTGEEARGALVCENLDRLHASIGRWMHSNAAFIAPVQRLEDALEDESPIHGAASLIQMMVCGPIARMAAAEAHLLKDPRITAVGAEDSPTAEITLHRTIYPDRDLSIVDILPAGCSKASALLHLAGLRGLAPSDILAIGDNWNDVPMLRLAGRAVLMSNAPGDLKALARESGWTITPTNDEDGVAIAIEAALETTPVVVS